MYLFNNEIIVAKQSLISSNLASEVAILDVDSGIYFGINDIGTSIWKLLQKPISYRELIQELLDIFIVDEETLREDVNEFLNRLIEATLIEIIHKQAS